MSDCSSWSSDHAEAIASFRSLIAPTKLAKTHESLVASLSCDKELHNFDLQSLIKSVTPPNHSLEFYDAVKIINFIRAQPASSSQESIKSAILKQSIFEETEDNEKFYKPILENDGYLVCCDELLQLIDSKSNENDNENNFGGVDLTDLNLSSHTNDLEQKLKAANELIARLTSGTENNNDVNAPPLPPTADNDSYYFDGYGYSHIHKVMLTDTVRTDSYRKSILNNPTLFKDKIVLDVGCGTGILSMFAAKAGAKKVIGVDDSNIIVHARKIVSDNDLSDTITLIRGKMEDIDLSPHLPLSHPKIDVIVSEWMGYALLYETMLPSVISARDRYMNPKTGIMWPNKTNMHIEAVSDVTSEEFWKNVYDFDMSSMIEMVGRERLKKNEAAVEVVEANKIISNRFEFWSAELTTVKDNELDFSR